MQWDAGLSPQCTTCRHASLMQAAGAASCSQRRGCCAGAAQVLGMRSRRRPIGYWQSAENLDEVCCHGNLARWLA